MLIKVGNFLSKGYDIIDFKINHDSWTIHMVHYNSVSIYNEGRKYNDGLVTKIQPCNSAVILQIKQANI